MQITDIKIHIIKIPLDKVIHFAWMPGKNIKEYGFTLIEINTDEGITGYGTSNLVGDNQVATSIKALYKEFLMGKNPFFVESYLRPFSLMKPFGAPPWALSQALWDIIGKAANQPLYKLWGAERDKVLAYAAPAEPRTPEQTKEVMNRYQSDGFKAVKLRLHGMKISEDIDLVQSAKKVVENKMDILVDANQALKFPTPLPHPHWDYKRALETAQELEKLKVFYLEEPLPMYDFDNLAKLNGEIDMYIAGGECNMGLHEFKILLEKNCYDVIQPDASLSEDLFQIKNIAALTMAHGKLFMPHTWGSGLNLFSNLQVALTVPDEYSPYFEYPYDYESWKVELTQKMILNPIVPDKDGFIHAPSQPGLGFELDQKAIKKYTLENY
ncbi:mandelate racemase/muconate lactonizing enzyme family protein [Atribacter laminatus]|uniref:D-galactarolactone cycloisomerase n=1 Tax=Atribacter laminatus TaxID=2847778 RepID=A0A7T1F203_ATRLM|nr:mandelate racemase/muconate lactonizing enzyme family protein [Atribacter laminatus]QPM66826.1 D-galactarolactone cycloisomerase [Atribacter laminatus]